MQQTPTLTPYRHHSVLDQHVIDVIILFHHDVSPLLSPTPSPPLPSPPLPLELYFIRFNWEYTLLEPGPLQLATSPLPSSPPPLPSSPPLLSPSSPILSPPLHPLPSYLLLAVLNTQVRIAERSVEGRHSRIHRVLKRAPRSSVAYLSLELRFCLLQELVSTQPECMRSLLGAWTRLETTSGMVRAVMPLCLSFNSHFFVILCAMYHRESLGIWRIDLIRLY